MALTNKQDILAVDDLEIEKIYVAPWKDDVYLRVMSSRERDAFELSMYSESGPRAANLNNFRARLAAVCLCDEQGNSIFNEKDAKELGKKSSMAMDIIVEKARKMNGITVKDQEEMVKKSEDAQEEDSNSDSA